MDALDIARRALLSRTGVGWGNRLLRHLLAGGVGTVLYLVGVAFLVENLHIYPVLAVVISFGLLELYSYLVYRGWVYQPTRSHAHAIPRFLVVTVIALVLNTAVMYLAVDLLRAWYVWGLLATTAVVPVTNFVLNLYWAFR